MALAHVNFYSDVLGLSCQADVILPERMHGIGQAGSERAGDIPVLWLLHGGSDDHTIWQRRTSIERYVAPLGIAVVMPAVHLSFYSNMAYGGRYFDYVSDELPQIMRDFFHFSSKREDNFVAGLSMGGYGALKLALTKVEQYAAAASLSGLVNIASLVESVTQGLETAKDPGQGNMFEWVFGDPYQVRGSKHDIFYLLEKAKKGNVDLPKLFASCGTEDFLYEDHLKFKAFARSLDVEITYHEEPGTHEWGFWDRNIQKVLEWLPLRK